MLLITSTIKYDIHKVDKYEELIKELQNLLDIEELESCTPYTITLEEYTKFYKLLEAPTNIREVQKWKISKNNLTIM